MHTTTSGDAEDALLDPSQDCLAARLISSVFDLEILAARIHSKASPIPNL